MQLLSLIDLTLRRWQRYGEVRRELASYNDRELVDMGLIRGDIPEIAREAAALVQPSPTQITPGKTKTARPRFAKVAHS